CTEASAGSTGCTSVRDCTYPVIRAGLPITIAVGCTSAVTTEPAATIASRPTNTPGRIVALAPMLAPRSMTVYVKGFEWSPLRGNGSLVNVALGPTNTS